MFQLQKRGLAGAKIVQYNPHAQSLELRQYLGGAAGLGHGHAFGDLQLYAGWIDTRLSQGFADVVDQADMVKLAGGKIDAEIQAPGRVVARAPLRQTTAGFDE